MDFPARDRVRDGRLFTAYYLTKARYFSTKALFSLKLRLVNHPATLCKTVVR